MDYLLKAGFDFKNKELLSLFKKKLEEDGFSSDLIKYRVNLGHSQQEIDEMKSRVKNELFPVLSIQKQKAFDIQRTLNVLNRILKDIE